MNRIALPPTLAAQLRGWLKDFPAARVARVRVEETSKNSFEVTADES